MSLSQRGDILWPPRPDPRDTGRASPRLSLPRAPGVGGHAARCQPVAVLPSAVRRSEMLLSQRHRPARPRGLTSLRGVNPCSEESCGRSSKFQIPPPFPPFSPPPPRRRHLDPSRFPETRLAGWGQDMVCQHLLQPSVAGRGSGVLVVFVSPCARLC